MFKTLYNIAVNVFSKAFEISSVVNPKYNKRVLGLKNQHEKLFAWRKNQDNVVWFHCASLGEHEMSKPIIQEISNNEKLSILISFFSPSGYENCLLQRENQNKCYLPFDTKKNAREFFNLIKPSIAIFIKYEFWFHHLEQIIDNNIPSYYLNLKISQGSLIRRSAKAKALLKLFTKLYSSHQETLSFLSKEKFKNGCYMGDSRINQALDNVNTAYSLPKHLRYLKDSKKNIIVFGSTYKSERTYISDLIKANSDNIFIIAPHEINDIDYNYWESIHPKQVQYYQNDTQQDEANIIIINSIGSLKYLYRFGSLVYIGGGFDHGIHNMIEPLAYGTKVVCGPITKSEPLWDEFSKQFGLKSMSKLEEIKLLKVDSIDWKNQDMSILHNFKMDINKITNEIISQL